MFLLLMSGHPDAFKLAEAQLLYEMDTDVYLFSFD